MEEISKRLLDSISSNYRTAMELIDSANERIRKFEFDKEFSQLMKQKDSFLKRGKEFVSGIEDLMKDVKDTLDSFTFTVRCNRDKGQELSWEIERNTLTVEVSSENDKESYYCKRSITIPSDCDVERLSVSFNDLSHTATIVIPKFESELENEEVEPETDEEVEGLLHEIDSIDEPEEAPKRHCLRDPHTGRFIKREEPLPESIDDFAERAKRDALRDIERAYGEQAIPMEDADKDNDRAMKTAKVLEAMSKLSKKSFRPHSTRRGLVGKGGKVTFD